MNPQNLAGHVIADRDPERSSPARNCSDFAISSGSDEHASAVRVMLAGGMSMFQAARVTGIVPATIYVHLGALQQT